jgi:hypothetical protein
MDVIRICGKGYFLKGEMLFECTPDEAATMGGMLSNAAAEWMNDSEEYQGFIAENDK